jgi:hypothetical protein
MVCVGRVTKPADDELSRFPVSRVRRWLVPRPSDKADRLEARHRNPALPPAINMVVDRGSVGWFSSCWESEV